MLKLADLQKIAQDGTFSIANDGADLDGSNGRKDLSPRKYAPRRRQAIAPSEPGPGREERLPMFLDRQAQEGEHEQRPVREEHENWDDRGESSAYASLRLPDPQVMEPPPALYGHPPLLSLILRGGALALVAAAVAGVLVFRQELSSMFDPPTADAKLSWTEAGNSVKSNEPASRALGPRVEAQQLPPQAAPAEPPRARAPRLVFDQGEPHGPGEAAPLGVSVDGESRDASFVVSGLPSGSALSVGRTDDNNEWTLTASDLEKAAIQPPPNFTGTMDLTVELRTADATVADRRSLRFQWAAPAVAGAMAGGNASRRLAPEEVASLLKRADSLIASRDVAAARLVLRRAAEAGDARGAMLLASTYDPTVLAGLGVHGIVPDADMARTWYETAKRLGSAEASRRLDALASRRN